VHGQRYAWRKPDSSRCGLRHAVARVARGNIALLVLTTPANSRPIHVRLRTVAARRYKMVANAEALIWKILTIAEEKFPRFNSPELL